MFYIYHDRQASGGKDKESILTFGIPFMSHYLKSTDMAAHSFLKRTRGKHQSHNIKSKKNKKIKKTVTAAGEVRKAAEMTAHLTDITEITTAFLPHREKIFICISVVHVPG